MDLQDCVERRQAAGRSLNERLERDDGETLVNRLADGMTALRRLFFTRIHDDVESKIGVDSMLLPVSPLKSEEAASVEIELFQIAEAAWYAQSRGYLRDMDWSLRWLAKLRLGEGVDDPRVGPALQRYSSQDADRRRLTFSTRLERIYPEARLAPLVLYRLFPFSVGIATALAFNAPADAQELRDRQTFWLPAIRDCSECGGAVLGNGRQCDVCGNPVWSYRWLNVAE